MKVKIDYANETPIIVISHYREDKPGEPFVAHISQPGYWEVALLRIQPRELIDALQDEIERLEAEAIEAQRITPFLSDYDSEQENYDREKYLEQKYG